MTAPYLDPSDWTDEPVFDLTPLLDRLACAKPTPSPVPTVFLPARPVPWLCDALDQTGGEE